MNRKAVTKLVIGSPEEINAYAIIYRSPFLGLLEIKLITTNLKERLKNYSPSL